MNKYDDIKRFMDKTNLKELDYKELNDKSTGESITGSMNQWTLIKQVSASQTPGGPLDSGRSTQPTPQAISADEFSPSSAQETLNAQHLPPLPTPRIRTTSHVLRKFLLRRRALDCWMLCVKHCRPRLLIRPPRQRRSQFTRRRRCTHSLWCQTAVRVCSIH